MDTLPLRLAGVSLLACCLCAPLRAQESAQLQYVRIIETESKVLIMQIGAVDASDCSKVVGDMNGRGVLSGFQAICTTDNAADRLPVIARARNKTLFNGQLVRFDAIMLMLCRHLVVEPEWMIELSCRLK